MRFHPPRHIGLGILRHIEDPREVGVHHAPGRTDGGNGRETDEDRGLLLGSQEQCGCQVRAGPRPRECAWSERSPPDRSQRIHAPARISFLLSSIGLSFFASGMGAWVVYGSTEMGASPTLSWLGVIGYSFASAAPGLIICIIGPHIREFTGEKAFCATDFGLARYGRLMQFSIGVIGVFYSERIPKPHAMTCSRVTSTDIFFRVLYHDNSCSPQFVCSVHLSRLRNDLHIQRLWSCRWT